MICVFLASYCPDDVMKKNEMGRHVERKGRSRDAYRVLVGTFEGKSQLGKPRRRWEDNSKWKFGGVDWMDLAEDRDK
jgi:hypothetical protein